MLRRTLVGVFADGFPMEASSAFDFDNPFQQMNLEAGPHKIEIRAPGFEPVAIRCQCSPRGDDRSTPRCFRSSSSPANIFVPELRMIGDELPHHPDAAFVLDHFHPHAARARQSSSSPRNVWFSPMTTCGVPYRRMAPVHIAHGDSVVYITLAR